MKTKKELFKIILLQLGIIFVFSVIYYNMHSDNFIFRDRYDKKDENNYLDYFYFSTVTSASTGFGDISPKTTIAKFIVTLQILLTYTNILRIFI